MKQIRQEHSFVSFSKHVRSLSIPVTPFENQKEKRLFERCIPALKLWISSSRCWIRPRQLKKPFIGAAESCASWSTLVRWQNARDDLAFQANRNWNFMTLSFSFECKMNFRKLFVGRPGNEDSITKTAKVPQSVQAVFLSFFFFFTIFAVFFLFFFFAKKLAHKQVRPRNVVVLISQLFICTVSWHWPRRARSSFFHNNVTWQYTLHIVT